MIHKFHKGEGEPCRRVDSEPLHRCGWYAHVTLISAAGTWTPTRSSLHIILLKMEAVFRTLSFGSLLPPSPPPLFLSGKRFLMFTDKVEKIFLWCFSHQIASQPGTKKLNDHADALSRQDSVLHTEWMLSHRVLNPG